MKFSLDNINALKQLILELGTGLARLTFRDNFQSFEITTTIAANTEKKIRNELTKTPRHVIIGKQTGNALVTAGDTEWTKDFVYMKNHDSTNSATVTLIFME